LAEGESAGMTEPAKRVPIRLAREEMAKNLPMTAPLFLTVVTSPTRADQVGTIMDPMNIWAATITISCQALTAPIMKK